VQPDHPIPTVKIVQGCLPAPASKSATQRALIAAALAAGRSRLRHPLVADDSRHLMACLNSVGIAVRLLGPEGAPDIEVEGQGGTIPAARAEVFAGNAGTAMRFLTAMLSLGHGDYIIDGDDRMRQRPIEDLLAALRVLGARAESVHGNGCPPVRVGGPGLLGGEARLSGETSSQYLSAILLAAPAAPRGVEIEIEGRLVSRPYVDLTIDVMRRFGVDVQSSPAGPEPTRFCVPAGRPYLPRDIEIEGDYSSASYFFAAAAVTCGRVRVERLDPESRQGDAQFVGLLERMGCGVRRGDQFIEVEGTHHLQAIEADCRAMPDIVPTLAVVALFAEGPTRITGVPHLKVKESDRIAALAAEIDRLGGSAVPAPDGLTIVPRPLHGARIETYSDHRMAMAFAVAGLRVPGVVIANPACVSKSFPGFWDLFDRLASAGA
jgi:3-phosphoshikimate 1-carboxyvinyltransferase